MSQSKLPPTPEPTRLDRLVDLVDEDPTALRALWTSQAGVLRRAKSVFLWIRVVLKTLAFTYVGGVFVFLLLAVISAYMFPESH